MRLAFSGFGNLEMVAEIGSPELLCSVARPSFLVPRKPERRALLSLMPGLGTCRGCAAKKAAKMNANVHKKIINFLPPSTTLVLKFELSQPL